MYKRSFSGPYLLYIRPEASDLLINKLIYHKGSIHFWPIIINMQGLTV